MAGIASQPLQPGMIGVPNRNARQGYNEPATGTPVDFPLNGVDASQQYDSATRLALSKQGADQGQAASQQQYDLSQKAQDAMMGRLPGLMSAAGGGTSGNVPYPGGVSPQQSQAAVEAEFARAKDKAGQIAKSAMTGLSDTMSARGMAGSGAQGEEAARIVNGQAGGLADLNREQAIQGLQFAQHANDVQYQGDITQRGQNIQQIQGLLAAMQNAGRLY